MESYNHECAKWLSEILTPLRHHSTTVKDTFDFLHRLDSISIDDKIMGSFDVRSLFTNIPVNFTINLILENIFTNDVKDFNELSKLQLKKLLHWTTKGTVFQFQGKLYEQTDGVAMGSPIAPLLVDVCMNWIFDQASPLLDQNTMLIRYVDIFCVTSNQTVFDIFRILSGIHFSIQFSKEIEQHHQLSFLDVLLTRNGNTLQTSVYRKRTHTGLYTKWTSLCPPKFKRNLINCLLHRAYTFVARTLECIKNLNLSLQCCLKMDIR